MMYGRSPAMDVLLGLRVVQEREATRVAIDALGLIEMNDVAFELAKLMNIPSSWFRTAEQIRIFERRSAAARRGWATRRARQPPHRQPSADEVAAGQGR